MSEPDIKVNIAEWVARVQTNDATYTQRQITEIILHAISMTPFLSRRLYLKGSVLMGLVYHSPRQTSDIDFSTSPDYLADNQTTDELRNYLDGSLPRAAATLGYIDTVLRVQSINEQPHKWHPGISFSFPALEVKIGYAIRGTPQEKQLERKEASNVVPLDTNFNEKSSGVQTLEFADNKTLLAYSLNDLIAEKYRAILEQVERNRERRQDVYDLDILIRKPGLKPAEIVNSLISKCEFRGISPKFDSITNPEIKKRSGAEWHTLELEIEELPDFEACFDRVVEFYLRLPWSTT